MKQLARYKLFLLAFLAMLFVSLIRIPFGTFNDASIIDVVSHVVLPATGAPLLLVVLQANRVVLASKRMEEGLFIFLLGVSLEVFWEIVEFFVDVTLKLHWQPSNADTMNDVILGFIGAGAGALLFRTLYPRATVNRD
jgi:glycopeptide antibiotics resistance protein